MKCWMRLTRVLCVLDASSSFTLIQFQIKEHELNPVVNRDLSKRVRPISGITLCRQVVRFDIQFSTKLVKALDEKIALYSREADEEQKDEDAMEIEVISFISIFLIEHSEKRLEPANAL